MAATSGQLRAPLVLPSNRGADPSSGAERNPQTQGEDAWSPHPVVCASGTWRLR